MKLLFQTISQRNQRASMLVAGNVLPDTERELRERIRRTVSGIPSSIDADSATLCDCRIHALSLGSSLVPAAAL
jgi:hypothetical protein